MDGPPAASAARPGPEAAETAGIGRQPRRARAKPQVSRAGGLRRLFVDGTGVGV